MESQRREVRLHRQLEYDEVPVNVASYLLIFIFFAICASSQKYGVPGRGEANK